MAYKLVEFKIVELLLVIKPFCHVSFSFSFNDPYHRKCLARQI